MLLFIGIFLLFYFLIWPAMWNDPIGTIIDQFQYPGRFLPETSQVNNEQSDKYLVPYVDENNQIFRYPENFLWRVTPISIFGLVFWIYFVLKHFDFFSSRKNRYISFSLLAFAINFTLLLTIPVKSDEKDKRIK